MTMMLSQMKNDLGDTGESLMEDKKFLADLDKNCDEKQKVYEAQVRLLWGQLLSSNISLNPSSPKPK